MTQRIGFLFLGPPTHVDHAISIACELQALPGHAVTVFVSTEENRQAVDDAVRWFPQAPAIEHLHPSAWQRFLRRFKKRLHPRVSSVLAHNAARLRGFDALVVTVPRFIERTGRRPLMVFTSHGAGDLAQWLQRPEAVAQVDYFLVSGQARWDRMQRLGYVSEANARITGYPKFDLARLRADRRGPLFDNANPVVVYNPHYRRGECSWPRWGTQVLDFFLANPHFNLVFAPHMLLFSKDDAPLDPKYAAAPNIRVDLDGPALSDMTYTSAADIYLGDISSQVYEFVACRHRPCVFLDAHGVDWRDDVNFRMWRMGPVLGAIEQLPDALANVQASFAAHVDAQRALVAETFSITDTPAGRRGAQAIAEWLARS